MAGRGRSRGSGQGTAANAKVPAENVPARTALSCTTRSSKQQPPSANRASVQPARGARGARRLQPESDDDTVPLESEKEGSVPPSVCFFYNL
jgi:hypothetical protein